MLLTDVARASRPEDCSSSLGFPDFPEHFPLFRAYNAGARGIYIYNSTFLFCRGLQGLTAPTGLTLLSLLPGRRGSSHSPGLPVVARCGAGGPCSPCPAAATLRTPSSFRMKPLDDQLRPFADKKQSPSPERIKPSGASPKPERHLYLMRSSAPTFSRLHHWSLGSRSASSGAKNCSSKRSAKILSGKLSAQLWGQMISSSHVQIRVSTAYYQADADALGRPIHHQTIPKAETEVRSGSGIP